MDSMPIVKQFASLQRMRAGGGTGGRQDHWTRIRLVATFGFNGSEVMYATADAGDKVYAYGPNRHGCLGLGTNDKDIKQPQLNTVLTGKRLMKIYYGFSHCIGLTESGQCYAWGCNEYGQLGIGTFTSSPTPQLIAGLQHRTVVAIDCGNRHTLALTSDGLLYGWGRNTFGAIGDNTWCWRERPTPVVLTEPIESIGCGKNHSLAISCTGRAYVWGLHDFGQLGRPIEESDHHICKDGGRKERAFDPLPKQISGLENMTFKKGCCGPNHTILLTRTGDIYTFGQNDFGQIGNGQTENMCKPYKLKTAVKFKDIVAIFDKSLSLAVSVDNRYWVWGYSFHRQLVTTPQDVSRWTSGFTIYDVYARYSGVDKTFRSVTIRNGKIVADSNNNNNKVVAKQAAIAKPNELAAIDDQLLANAERLIKCKLSVNPFHDIGVAQEEEEDEEEEEEEEDNNEFTSSDGYKAVDVHKDNDDMTAAKVFHNCLSEAFDNHLNFDIEFVFNHHSIYCHKTILQIRNRHFWESIKDSLVYNNEVFVENNFSYESMYAFIKYLYSLTPDITVANAGQLLLLAATHNEPELLDMCGEFLQSSITMDSICSVYQIAVGHRLPALESHCARFAANHWKDICKTQSFESMDDQLMKQLFKTIFT
ncbi:uncharacterized protein LOC128954046 [Oppia nitens]|uniref:uncharacterized protein LOC128954046 n=1 Tax=Oppia nitens TaxID=1686743 RepID=UPI0023DC3632|nr:uncharacterized protein LOC128954046 [Oppia nitens]